MGVVDWARTRAAPVDRRPGGGSGRGRSGPRSGLRRRGVHARFRTSSPPTEFGGTFSGLTLAATGVDIVRALLEGIACEFSLTLDALRRRGIEPRLVRATGGGSKNAWFLQLLADVSGVPVEVVAQDEPGAFGAAILAGVGAGVYKSVSAAVAELVAVSRRFEPDAARGARYAGVRERIAAGAAAVPAGAVPVEAR